MTYHPACSQGLKLADLGDVKYKGDSMQRPITSNEIGWLVRLLVWLSISLNQRLHLGSATTSSPDEPELLVRIPYTFRAEDAHVILIIHIVNCMPIPAISASMSGLSMSAAT